MCETYRNRNTFQRKIKRTEGKMPSPKVRSWSIQVKRLPHLSNQSCGKDLFENNAVDTELVLCVVSVSVYVLSINQNYSSVNPVPCLVMHLVPFKR